jgi:hypothetical protein
MGKFYVYIRLDSNRYKVSQEDITRVHSHRPRPRPPIPAFPTASRKRQPSTSPDPNEPRSHHLPASDV